jgi:serine/threonine protein kinase
VSEETLGGPGEFAVGSLVAGYRLEEQIGRGGMAVVFRAHDSRLERPVALKIMAPGLALDDAFRQRFIRESRAAAAVDDSHIIPVYEAGEENGVLFIAMRYVRGGDVRTLLDRDGWLTPGRATEIISQVASALDSAHAGGLVHRDVKPANMLLEESADSDRPDHVYLSDFGLTKTALASSGLTATGQFLGTLDYVAPEQIEGRPVDGRTDLYALACAAFELLTGAPPFRRDQGMAVMYAQVSEAPPLLSSRRAGLPAAADAVMNRALAKAPDDRYATCREFASELRRVFGLRVDPASDGPDADRPATQVAGRPATQIAAPVRPAESPGPSARVTPDRDAPGQQTPIPPTPRPGAADRDKPAVGTPVPETAAPAAAGRWTPGGSAAPAKPEPDASGRKPAPVPSAGPPTQAAGIPPIPAVPPISPTKPGLTDPSAGPPGPTDAADWLIEARPWWRSPLAVAAAILVVVLLLGGGGYLLVGRGNNSGHAATSGGGNGTGTGNGSATQLAAPVGPGVACSTAAQHAASLSTVTTATVDVHGGTPFAVQESKDGKYTFVTVNNGLAVLSNVSGAAPTFLRLISVPGPDKGLFPTEDGHYLLIANGDGVVVVDAAKAEDGAAKPVLGEMTGPALSQEGNGAVGVRATADGKFVFVTLQNTTKMAVFNLGQALADNFSKRALVGYVPLGIQPVGIGQSPDGSQLYVTSFQAKAGTPPAEGTLSVVDTQAAETDPATAVRATVQAGCSPARIITGANGATVWVTARDSNSLLGFSASKLVSDPGHALVAQVRVGAEPIGLTLVRGGRLIVVADSNYTDEHNPGTLAVVDPAKAIAGRAAVLGYVTCAGQPRQLTAAVGNTILVTDQVSNEVEQVKVSELP